MDLKFNNGGNSDFNKIMFEWVRNTILPTNAPLYKYAEQYGINAIVYTLINYKAMKASQIKPVLFKTKDKGAAKEFKKWNGKAVELYDRIQVKKAKEAGIEELYLDDIGITSEYYRLKNLLKRPNEWQSWSEFIYSLSAFYDISGNCVINAPLVGAKGKLQPAMMYSLPSHLIKIVGGSPTEPIKAYTVDGNGYTQNFDAEECHAIRSFSTNYDKFGSQLYGTSKVGAAYTEILTYAEAKNREYTGFKTGDSAHILMPDSPDAQMDIANDSSVLAKFRQNIYRFLNGKDSHQAAIVGQKLAHINLSSTLDKSKTQEAKAEIKENLASVWSLPSRIVFNSSGDSTYNNLKEDTKRGLRDGVFPWLNQLEECLNENIVKKNFGIDLAFDYDCYEELNYDIIDQMAKFKDITILSTNELRQWAGFDALDIEEANIPDKYNMNIIPANGYGDNTE